ncbi:MAG: hypothetical protein AB7Q42_18535 [Acidimicrobiia bacterium]
MRRSTIVEFSGIPGAGKSFLAHELAAALAADGQLVDEPLSVVSPQLRTSRRAIRKLWLAALEALREPVAAAGIAVAIARSGQSTRDLVHRVQNWLVVRALYRRSRSRPGTHVFDQGIVQELCSIGYRGRWQACLEAAAPGRRDLAPDVIVRVATPVGTATRRLAARSGAQSRVEELDAGEQDRVLRGQVVELDEIERAWVDRFGQRRGTRRVEVDNDGPIVGATLERILDALG